MTAIIIKKARLYRPTRVATFSLRVSQMMMNIKIIDNKLKIAKAILPALLHYAIRYSLDATQKPRFQGSQSS